VFASRQIGSFGTLQRRGVPAHAPPALHWSALVQGSPSSQLAPDATANVQVPPEHTPAAWHWSGGAPQTTPMHGSAVQKPDAPSQPKLQVLSVVVNLQVPVPAWQMPPEKVRCVVELKQVGAGGVHTTADPPQEPFPSH
jgi:hypothetical protein